MADLDTLRDSIAHELKHSQEFFVKGEPGKGRVCARKAAGLAARYWLGIKYPQEQLIRNPFEALVLTQKRWHGDTGVEMAINNLLMKVDENYQLPEQIDLLASAKLFIEQVFSEV